MWKIGIKSGFITVLGLIVYVLFIQQLMGLGLSLWGHLGYYVVLALGIYSGHYYYKTANNGLMTYKQGLKMGLIVISFFALLYSFFIYLFMQYIDAFIMDTSITVQLAEAAQKDFFQQKGVIAQALQFKVIQHMVLELLFIIIFFCIVLQGFILTLIIAVFSRNHKKTAQP